MPGGVRIYPFAIVGKRPLAGPGEEPVVGPEVGPVVRPEEGAEEEPRVGSRMGLGWRVEVGSRVVFKVGRGLGSWRMPSEGLGERS
ncbi:hypothetical protein MRX96_033112 [Rhipicephalus microplus]